MKIRKVEVNNHRKVIVISTRRGSYDLPFVKLEVVPRPEDPIAEIYVDPELGSEAITYQLESGLESSIHLDVFLDYHRDPKFLRKLFVFELTIEAQKALRKSQLSKNEVCRRLKTSPSQLARLLDQTNERKSVDKMLELLAVLGVSVRPKVAS